MNVFWHDFDVDIDIGIDQEYSLDSEQWMGLDDFEGLGPNGYKAAYLVLFWNSAGVKVQVLLDQSDAHFFFVLAQNFIKLLISSFKSTMNLQKSKRNLNQDTIWQ